MLVHKSYDSAMLVQVGTRAYIRSGGKLLKTTVVQFANASCGVFRTKNSLYIPSPSCRFPFFILN